MDKSITQEQRDRRNALLAHLEEFATPELIVASHQLCITQLDVESQRRFRRAMAAAWALGKIESYLLALDSVNGNRHSIGAKIHDLREHRNRMDPSDFAALAAIDLQVSFLSGQQEVTYHFFAETAHTIGRLLKIVTNGAGCDLPKDISSVFSSYTPLRDYFSHIDERGPGGDHSDQAVTESVTPDSMRISHQIPFDNQGRPLIDGTPIEVTNKGVGDIREALGDVIPTIRKSCINRVKKHSISHPDDTPSPENVPFPLLVKIPDIPT